MDSDLEVYSVFGGRGAGKTTNVKNLLSDDERKRIAVYDVKDEYPFKKIHGKAQLVKFLKANWHKDFKISYVPPEYIQGTEFQVYPYRMLPCRVPYKHIVLFSVSFEFHFKLCQKMKKKIFESFLFIIQNTLQIMSCCLL